MSQLSNLGAPINAALNFQPGGNPYAGLASGGLAGLAMQYGQDYNSYVQTNQQNYNNIVGGYNTVLQNVGNTLGQGGNGWGVAQGAANAITAQGNKMAGGAIQNSINSGVGKSTAAVAAQRGASSDTQQALGQLGNSLANTYAGYQSGIGQNQLAFMNSVNAPPPNAAAYSALYQQYGTQQQAAANMALQQEALTAQQKAASAAGGRGGGGGGGVSVGAAPRGGTYGSGGSGVGASGGGVAPNSTSSPFDPYSFLKKPSGSGSQTLTLGGTDPWEEDEDEEGDGSDGTGGNFGPNSGFGDMAGQFGFSGMQDVWS